MKKLPMAVGLLLILGLPALWIWGRPAWRQHQQTHAVEQGRKFLAKKDFRNAQLSARKALLINPKNVAACELMADLAEIARAPQQFLEYRERIAQFAPTVDNKLKLAQASLLVQEAPWPIAVKVLQEISSEASQVAKFHELSAELALKQNRPTEAELQFLAAAQLEPANQAHKLNAAVLRLHSTNLMVAAQARATLEQLAADPELGATALRSLVSDSLVRTNFTRAEALSQQLVDNPRADLSDRLQQLAILKQDRSEAFARKLADLKKNVETNAAAVQAVSAWMIGQEMAAEALGWLTNCSSKLQAEQPVRLAIADCLVALKDWAGLDDRLQDQKWGEFEAIRLALLSYVASQQNNETSADAEWRLAVRQAGDKLPTLNALLTLCKMWGRDKQREDLLLNIAEKFPREEWAYRELDHLYAAAGNTHALNKLYSAICSADSSDLEARNNFATTCMLLGVNVSKANEIARQNFEKSPDQPVIVSTYAFSLHLQGRTKEGLAVFDKLPVEQRLAPGIALYYAVLLRADGQGQRALECLAHVRPAELLPEERALLSAAKDKGV